MLNVNDIGPVIHNYILRWCTEPLSYLQYNKPRHYYDDCV